MNVSRIVQSINSSWEFRKAQTRDDGAPWERIELPHCWNSTDLPEAGTRLAPSDISSSARFAGYGTGDGRDYYRGACWYRKTLPAQTGLSGRRSHLRFEGANQDCVVFVNGARIGEHLGGYTSFTFDITDSLRPGVPNILEVRLSNAHNDDVPPVGGDLGHFGGIYRPVWLISTGLVHFDLSHYGSDGVYWDTPGVSSDLAHVELSARLVNDSAARKAVRWMIDITDPSGATVARAAQDVSLESGVAPLSVECGVDIDKPLLWSPATPNLYRIHHRLVDPRTSEVFDDVETPLGLRFFSIDAETGFHLNGERLFIRGVGRHQDYPGLGYAVPVETQVADTRTIKAMGANAMRSHYPLCDGIYHECDRSGLLVWAKIPVMDRMNESPAFLDNARRMFTELITQMRNHPSIIFWGYTCEILGDADWFWPRPRDPEKLARHFDAALEFCRDLERLAKQLDPMRLTCNDFHCDPNPDWYRETGLTEVNDVNGWNVYHGWYHESLERAAAWVTKTREYAPKRPYILAEYGAGVDERIHAHQSSIYDMSPEYAQRFHEHYHRVFDTLPWLAGVFIWTWSDFQRTSLGDSMKHINNKGMVTGGRRPKDAFYQYQAWWHDKPMLRLARHASPRLAGIAGPDGLLRETVRVYSNDGPVELFVNGVSFGSRACADGTATWDVPFTEGDNLLVARSRSVLDSQRLRVDIFPADLKSWRRTDQRLCINIGQTRFSFHDTLSDCVWLPDRIFTEGSFGCIGGDIFRSWPDNRAWDGIRDGVNRHIRGTELQPVYQNFRIGSYRFRADIPCGTFELTLHMCEPFDSVTRRENRVPHGAAADGSRRFDVVVNSRMVIPGLDLADQYGAQTAFTETFVVKVAGSEGLDVELVARSGLPLLCGLTIKPQHIATIG